MAKENIAALSGQILGQIPLARFGRPEEVAAVASLLLPRDASYVTGSEYVLDRGMSELHELRNRGEFIYGSLQLSLCSMVLGVRA